MHSLRKKIVKDGNYAKQYSAFMTEMLQKGYAEQVTTANPGNAWYIPHFVVQHPEKPDRVRVVFDCKQGFVNKLLATVSRAPSENPFTKSLAVCFSAKFAMLGEEQAPNRWISITYDLLLQGPDMMNSLLGVFKFRGGLFAYTGDINTMFYQVRVSEHQWDYLRFFWWENSFDEEPKEWRMEIHLFGTCSSPSIANFALKQTASDFVKGFSEGARDTVANNFYVDDSLRAEDREDALLVNLLEVKELCKKGGFTLTKFRSPCIDIVIHPKGVVE
ncbi:uncharacterized protein [Palaemon carinicauda]|uniref:uncharacterized protein n=1 Tax=Palaemon carinicauda TaxID=392227 RepID=UPI0035B5A68F